jgi:hypothetical protein
VLRGSIPGTGLVAGREVDQQLRELAASPRAAYGPGMTKIGLRRVEATSQTNSGRRGQNTDGRHMMPAPRGVSSGCS